MNILEEFIKKHKKELEKLVENKFISSYHKRSSYLRYTTASNIVADSYNLPKEYYSHSIVKVERPMTISDLFTHQDFNEDYKKIYELELEIEDLRKLKSSIINIKSVLGEVK